MLKIYFYLFQSCEKSVEDKALGINQNWQIM